MSLHPSLSSQAKGKRHRSVLKRYERIEKLKNEDKWAEEDSVFGLPKVKIIKFKLKKEKPVEAVEAVEGAEAAAAAEGAAAPAEAEKGKAEKAEKKEEAPAKEKGKK